MPLPRTTPTRRAAERSPGRGRRLAAPLSYIIICLLDHIIYYYVVVYCVYTYTYIDIQYMYIHIYIYTNLSLSLYIYIYIII